MNAVVLAHGLLGLGAKTASKLLNTPYFNQIDTYLRLKHGLRVLATDVEGVAHSSIRGTQLLEQIRKWPERKAGERVTVIAHSQGGLDARWAISQLGGEDVIHKLITLSTPHRGSALCEQLALPMLQNSPDRLRSIMESVCVPVDAAVFLSPEAMRDFNLACPDSPNVTYQSLGGARQRHIEYWAPFIALAPLLNRYERGLNDGLVTVASSRWGEYLGTLNHDHVDMINFPLKAIHRPRMEPLWDYLTELAVNEGTLPLPDKLSVDDGSPQPVGWR